MITYRQYKDLVESFGYKLKISRRKLNIFGSGIKPTYIDISNNEYVTPGFMVMEWKSNRTVDHWTTDNHEQIGPSYDDCHFNHIKEINTSSNICQSVDNLDECKKLISEFTKNWILLKKEIRLKKIEEL